jgi:hypothetical protein
LLILNRNLMNSGRSRQDVARRYAAGEFTKYNR